MGKASKGRRNHNVIGFKFKLFDSNDLKVVDGCVKCMASEGIAVISNFVRAAATAATAAAAAAAAASKL